MNLDFKKMGGLLPAIAQDHGSGKVLMVGFMNEEAFHKTLKSGCMTFYSRTRQKLWTKGEESGNRLEIVRWSADCDRDTLLFLVHAQGPTCHKGYESCFAETMGHTFPAQLSFLSELEKIVTDRIKAGDKNSYTLQLARSGPERMAQKIGEEAVETVIAMIGGHQDQIINETADLMYHLIVGLSAQGIGLEMVSDCLEKRHRSAKD